MEQQSQSEVGARLLAIVERTVLEARPGHAVCARVTAQSRFGRDLGLDSVSHAELILRVEREFSVDLSADALAAETPAALLPLILCNLGQESSPATQERFPGPELIAGEPLEAATLGEALAWHLEMHPERIHLYLYGEGDSPEILSYRDLHHAAVGVAAGLAAEKVRPGESVALMLSTGRDYFAAFVAALYLDAVPVPIYPPARLSQLEEHLRRHGRILANARARVLITMPEASRLSRLLQAEAPALAIITTVAALAREGSARTVASQGDHLALLQYTSGSTGDPKGVMLSHAQILANIRAMGERLGASSRDVVVSWLPLYHDMGLIGAWLGSLYFGTPLVVMSPLDFLSRPLRWLQLIHRHQGSISGGPNFGYELCIRALSPERVAGLDLSSWRVAFNGAEPVSPVTLERFQEAMEPLGLSRSALSPVYGLAESAVGLCLPLPGRSLVIDRVDRHRFTQSGSAEPAAAEQPDTLRFCSCGPPLRSYELRVVDDNGRELPERKEGGLEFRGPSATGGYFNNPEASRELRNGDWLITGDRGYLADGEVFVTGRSKDVIVRGGRNLYPYELEEALGAVPGVRKGCVAVFGDSDLESGVERLIVVAETHETEPSVLATLRSAIFDCSLDVLGVPADDVRLTPPHSVLKTSSGKIRRAATRELYRNAQLGARPAALWWQLTRLSIAVLVGRLRRGLASVGAHLYAGYAWCIFGLSTTIVTLACLLLPQPGWRRACARIIARATAALTGIRIATQGLQRLPRGTPCILVANHGSYLDGFVLTAAIPRDFRYLAKRELAAYRLAGLVLRRLGVLFVDRDDSERARADAQLAFEAAARGASLAFFPEGTLSRQPGLRPFHLGAFLTAARCRLPVVPVALRGTRSLLRDGEWYPRWGRVCVCVGEPVWPQGEGWAAALALRDQAFAHILSECGEPDLS